MGVGGQRDTTAALPRGRHAAGIMQEAGSTPGLFWMARKILPPLGFEP
jgi:hypothetical protein